MNGADTLSRVSIAATAVQRWHAAARRLVIEAQTHGVRRPADIPDELARVEPDGALTIYVQLPDGAEVSMRVEPAEWAWIGPRNN